ncbi:translocation and assembly module lipoprotein TamL [Flavihumibacter profundi]|uniref:translocation and assembly module lipoprotein TamL n=1 Tax=Flavihumibacter profundi TaxID=2716883 RepID=UPI001CC5DE66|nr:BamA/TamA family outer membrane protein [Flavihumibacter profundi]MBZ5856793.1 BamA/TamA family outer membrane protein [Flavihumibacter profundi]
MLLTRYHTGIIILLVLALPLLLLSSCSTTKYVPEGDKLYTGAKIVPVVSKLDKKIKFDLEKHTRPKPNTSFLGIKYKLLIFNAFKEPKKPKGFIYQIKHKFGQPPVLLSEVKQKSVETKIQQELFDIGFMKPAVTGETISKNRKASLQYNVKAGSRYKINNLFYPSDSNAIGLLIKKSAENSLIKKGDYFNLNTLKSERTRIDLSLKENGYFFFEPDFLFYKVDSLHQGFTDLYLTIKPEMPATAGKTWNIGDIVIYGNYILEKDSLITRQEGRKEKEFTVVDNKETYKTSLYKRAIMIGKGQTYNRDIHELTVERLMNLNTFKFVKMLYSPVQDSTSHILNTRIYLTPARKQSLRLELSGTSKSTNYVGSEISLNYKNLNLFKGAEVLEAKISGGFDVQVGGNESSSNAYLFGAEVTLSLPKLLPGFWVNSSKATYMPRTLFSMGIEYNQRPDLYTMRSMRTSVGYSWKKGKAIEHTLRLININFIYPSNITEKFDSILTADPTLRASYEEQLIIGALYRFQYNNSYRTKRRFNYAFDGLISSSGNLSSLIIKSDVDTIGAKQLGNVPISQFIRLQADLRGYWRLNPKFDWANRIIAGVGFSYGNSAVMPYSEQFFIGGSSSIRAFRIRTLGPGSYYTKEEAYQANESGDIKTELNSELRYNMSKYIKLGAFVDAGNIWLRNEPADKPGSGLNKGDFFNEMAVGAGLGLRLDVSLMVLRFDLAMPLRKPWYPEGSRWVFNEIDPGNSQWRKDNLILNIAIGYPF